MCREHPNLRERSSKCAKENPSRQTRSAFEDGIRCMYARQYICFTVSYLLAKVSMLLRRLLREGESGFPICMQLPAPYLRKTRSKKCSHWACLGHVAQAFASTRGLVSVDTQRLIVWQIRILGTTCRETNSEKYTTTATENSTASSLVVAWCKKITPHKRRTVVLTPQSAQSTEKTSQSQAALTRTLRIKMLLRCYKLPNTQFFAFTKRLLTTWHCMRLNWKVWLPF